MASLLVLGSRREFVTVKFIGLFGKRECVTWAELPFAEDLPVGLFSL
jgi:hypothetical protein